MEKDTIFASVTKNQKTAISIIRISGPKSKVIAKKLLRKELKTNFAHLRKIYSINNEYIDQGIAIFFSKLNSSTGEDVLELHVHGSFAVITKIEHELCKIKNVREAEPGEFTKRSFYNNKLDLLQVEGLEDLLDSSTDLQRKQANLSFMGSVSSRLELWKQDLIELASFIETAIDFSDEVLPEETIKIFNFKLQKLKSKIKEANGLAEYSKKVREGVRVIITGPPNAGKSSLINCILDENLSIVTDEPGTTRDIISSTVDIDGILVNFYDTAGLHDTKNNIEAEGVRRAKELLEISDIQIRVVDGSDTCWRKNLIKIPKLNDLTIDLINKSDLVEIKIKKGDNCYNVSTKTNHNIKDFKKALKKNIKQVVNNGFEPIIFRDRHKKITKMLFECLNRIELKDIYSSPELIAEDIRHALSLIGKITGTVDVEDILDNLFKRFCIGK